MQLFNSIGSLDSGRDIRGRATGVVYQQSVQGSSWCCVDCDVCDGVELAKVSMDADWRSVHHRTRSLSFVFT